jgi:hypothetical protein
VERAPLSSGLIVQALEAAAVLAGDVRPSDYGERHERWRRQLAPANVHRVQRDLKLLSRASR